MTRSIDEVVLGIKTAIALLESAEHAWPQAVEAVLGDPDIPELAHLEELLHCATHETSSSLAFLVHDIEALLARSRVRQKFAVFTAAQFERIVRQGWSPDMRACETQ